MRLPDFLIPGVMKAGSTTVFRWLATHPNVMLPAVKEPNFFCEDRRSLEPYAALFAGVPADRCTGEASVRYMRPDLAEATAARIAASLPHVKAIVVLREPVERLRSEYRHQAQKGRERRPLVEAVRDRRTYYVAQSCYTRALKPFLDALGRENVCVVRTEDLLRPETGAAARILDHLGLEPIAAPATADNVTAAKVPFSPLMRRVWDAGLEPVARRVPKSVRRRLRPIVVGDEANFRQLLAASRADLPMDVLDELREDARRLRDLVDVSWDA